MSEGWEGGFDLSDDMKTYLHTQRAEVILALLVTVALIMAAVGVWVIPPLAFPAPALVIAAWLFHSLTIEVTDRELRWGFGPRVFRKTVALGEIASARIVRTNWIEGWGIHYSRFGWLYNVSGFEAVAITLKNGRKFALGTDEPAVLCAKLVGACAD